MPTPHDHYREAEQLLRMATVDLDQLYAETNLMPAAAIAAAQVHATLALAADHGADKPPVTVHTSPPATAAQGEEITDQMGGTVAVSTGGFGPCSHPNCFDHQGDGTHVDSEGRYFRG